MPEIVITLQVVSSFLRNVDLFLDILIIGVMSNKGKNMKYNKRHGGPYDRGGADSYYRRPYNPHYFLGASYNSRLVKLSEMTAKEIADYTAGFRDNEKAENFK